ncbi:DUF5829 family protein [Streptomyces sp. B1866]|uniref:DUF5829 family protein n=1 Tax=Streptomyces sp. B1866 TaxID=3075431 RepID=UPI0028911B32|nr:DUF5829 family protein [Streptomyces sp. B1866]MDT3397678.1 DUF5829 family protein [Streptomyces sp. B1866]
MTTEPAARLKVPVPRIDHVMVLLDEDGHREVSASGFVAERFGRIRRKQADSSVAGPYATLGVAGEHTLIEFFGAALPAASPLVGGLVFTFEEPGSSLAARALLDASGHGTYRHDLVRRTERGTGERRPWYRMIDIDLGEGSPLLLFFNEVVPEYFRAIGARPAPDGRLRRRDYLAAALGEPYDGTKMMRDITGVTLAVGPRRARHLADALSVFGFRAADRAAHGVSTGIRELRGPGLRIRLDILSGADGVDGTGGSGGSDGSGGVGGTGGSGGGGGTGGSGGVGGTGGTGRGAGPGAAGERITEIEVSLTPGSAGPAAPAEYRFGPSARLVIDTPERARWVFDPPGRAGSG